MYLKLGFNVLQRILDTYSRILFSLFNYNFVTADMNYNLFKSILEKIDNAKKKNDRIVCNEEIVLKENFKPFIEWLLVYVVKYITRDYEAILALLYRNIQSISPKNSDNFNSPKINLAAAAFIKVLYLVKYAIFRVNEDLYTLMPSNALLFY